ncbi:MAG: tetratricopeptide repeat protein [Terriglobales bacterium]|jgi:tetratricopeptide (TPR) repeat protein
MRFCLSRVCVSSFRVSSFRVSRARLSHRATITLLCLLLAATAWPQSSGQLMITPMSESTNTMSAILVVDVSGENRAVLDRQALVKAFHKESKEVLWQTTDDNSEASLTTTRPGQYEIEVSAVGYLTFKSQVMIPDTFGHFKVDVDLKKDPSAIELKVSNPLDMPAKARKEMGQGVAALKSGKWKQAQKHLSAANILAPSDPEVKFLIGYLFFQQKDFQQSEAYLISASTLDPHNVQALALLGRLQIRREDFSAARRTLEQATAADPDYWMAHNLLAETYLRQKDYEKARQQAQLAIDKGKGAGNSAQVLLGEALENLGRDQEALQAYRAFVTASPSSPMATEARARFDDLRQRDSSGHVSAPVTKIVSSSAGADALLASSEPVLSMKSWAPPDIDDFKPAIAEGVSCPYEQVINGVGDSVKEFVDDLGRFSAIEDLLHEDFDDLGHPFTRTVLKFNYLASVSELTPGIFDVDELRNPPTSDFPDQIATRGLPSLALIFHPDIRDDFQMVCEGLGGWHGEATWLVHFQQRENKPHRIQSYKIAGNSYPTSLKGRAWITADGYHLVHLESDLISPMPEIRLFGEHLAIDYTPQLFEKRKVQLWLPKNAELYFDFRGHHYLRRHSFDHFMLFSVDSEEKRNDPRASKQPSTPPQ